MSDLLLQYKIKTSRFFPFLKIEPRFILQIRFPLNPNYLQLLPLPYQNRLVAILGSILFFQNFTRKQYVQISMYSYRVVTIIFETKMSKDPKQKKSRKNYNLIQRVSGNLKKFRLLKNLSQEQLHDETGLSISRYESGKNDMTLTTLSILSEHLGVDPYQLLEHETEKLN